MILREQVLTCLYGPALVSQRKTALFTIDPVDPSLVSAPVSAYPPGHFRYSQSYNATSMPGTDRFFTMLLGRKTAEARRRRPGLHRPYARATAWSGTDYGMSSTDYTMSSSDYATSGTEGAYGGTRGWCTRLRTESTR